MCEYNGTDELNASPSLPCAQSSSPTGVGVRSLFWQNCLKHQSAQDYFETMEI